MAVHIVCRLHVHSVFFFSKTEMWLQCCSQEAISACLVDLCFLLFQKSNVQFILMFDFTNSDSQQGSTSNMTAGHCIFFTGIYPYRLFFVSVLLSRFP